MNEANTYRVNMKRSLRLILSLLAVAIMVTALTGCNPSRTFTDGTGRSVTLKGTPKRIVSVNPAHTETLFALGLGDRVVGVDSYSYRPAEAAKKEQVGDAFNLNLEKIVSLKPDLVILAGSKDMPPSQLADIERLGIPAYVSAPATVKEVLGDIEALASAIGAANKKGWSARCRKTSTPPKPPMPAYRSAHGLHCR